MITLGDGNKSLFWQDNCSWKVRLCDISSDLFKIASQKKCIISKELENYRWISVVSGLNTMDQLREFLIIADVVANLTIDPLQPDMISWLWTSNRCYSAKSAYKAQFIGSFPSFSTNKVWRADAEPKCTMFSWLVLHEKILSADRLAVRGWPHDPIYHLCLRSPETA
jgi:hypothetical protein